MKANPSFGNKIFRLSTGEEVVPSVVEHLIEKTCHYVKYALVTQNDKKETVAFLFPNRALYAHPDYVLTANDGCFCPRSLHELGKCMSGCLKLVNHKMGEADNQLKEAILIHNDKGPGEEAGLSYEQIIEAYRGLLTRSHGVNVPEGEEIFFIKNI